MKILSTRTFASNDAGLPVALPRTPVPRQMFSDGDESVAASQDVRGDFWLAATGVVDVEREALLAQAARAAAAGAVQSADLSDAWIQATGAGFA